MDSIFLLLIFLFLLFAIVGSIIFFTLRNQRNQIIRAQQRREDMVVRARKAVWAGATIVTARHHTSAEEMREKVRMDLTLQVHPPNGAPYTARTSWHLPLALISLFQPGQSISVKIDVDDPHLIFPNQPGTEIWP